MMGVQQDHRTHALRMKALGPFVDLGNVGHVLRFIARQSIKRTDANVSTSKVDGGQAKWNTRLEPLSLIHI